ncbi:MAG TPA: hypothetical protein VMU67_13665 [Steroidobacteraceae bacterium]|nr:hypothetical protein [Steroidobacteraceae bacterium]
MISIRRSIPAAAVLLIVIASASSPTLAAAGRERCDRACLQAIAERYLAAMVAHDPTKAPLAPRARYTEDGVELTLPDGLWRTADRIGRYRLFVTDPQWGSVGFFAKATENGAPVLLATRLKVVGGRITEIESNAVRLSATVGGGPSALARVDQLGDAPRKQFTTTLPPGERHTRRELIAIANSYFSGIENNTGNKPPPFAADCLRLENGTQTTGRPVAAGATPGPLNFSCRTAFALGYYREDTRLRNRRFVAVDVERGLVYAIVYFDHDAALRSYTLTDGRTVHVRNTAPWTWAAHEIFEVNGAGQISQVEAVLQSVPYGLRPGWSTGAHMTSPAAVRDHFREY